jgi:hypothetical protein
MTLVKSAGVLAESVLHARSMKGGKRMFANMLSPVLEKLAEGRMSMSKEKSIGEKALEKVMEEQEKDDNEVTQYISDAVAEKFVLEESGMAFVRVILCAGCKHYAAHTMLDYGWCCLSQLPTT